MRTSHTLKMIQEYQNQIKFEKRRIAESVEILKRHVRIGSLLKGMMELERETIVRSSQSVARYESYILTLRNRLTVSAHVGGF